MRDTCLRDTSPTPAFAAFIGIDRSDAKLDFCLQVPGAAQSEYSILENTPETVAPWLEALRVRFNGGKVAVCIEQPAGGLLYHFLNCQWLVVYAVNPMALARHRETLITSRAKSDAIDAYYLMDLVRQYHEHLPVWQPGDAAIRAQYAVPWQPRIGVAAQQSGDQPGAPGKPCAPRHLAVSRHLPPRDRLHRGKDALGGVLRRHAQPNSSNSLKMP